MLASKPAYQAEPSDDFVQAIWKRGRITPLEFFRIAAWKSAKGLASLSLNSEAVFAQSTSAALIALTPLRDVDVCRERIDWDEWQTVAAGAIGSKLRGTGLLGLRGVGYPMATAIVCILAPRAFPVMDRWAITALAGDAAGTSARWHRAAVYRQYAELLATSTSALFDDAESIHARDKKVMDLGSLGTERPSDLDALTFIVRSR